MKRMTRPFPKTLAMIMAGGKGERIMPLTEHRSKPAVPFAAKYRPVDFVLSNVLTSGIRSRVDDSLLGQGCRIVDADIKQWIIGRDTTIEPGAWLEECIVLDGAVVGSQSRLRRVIIDRVNRLEHGTTIGFDAAADRKRFELTQSGLVLLRQGYAESRTNLFQHATVQ
jgi:ADP-glucose pyrophosphorylase